MSLSKSHAPKRATLLVLSIFFSMACNKSTNVLPNIKPPEQEFVKTKYLFGNSSFLETKFTYKPTSLGDSLHFVFKNVFNADLSGLKVIVESKNELEQYDSSHIVLSVNIPHLPKDSSSLHFSIPLNNVQTISPENYEVYIVGLSNNIGHFLSGHYSSRYSWFEDSLETKAYLQLYAIVEVDGSCVIRLKQNKEQYWTVKEAHFEWDGTFMGPIYQNDEIISLLQITDSSSISKNENELRLPFKMTTPVNDRYNKLILNLSKIF